MRLWHKDLICVLPRQQLVSQWRELCSIFVKQDSHVLINFVYDYPLEHLRSYSQLVKDEFANRGYSIKDVSLEKEKSFFFWNKTSNNILPQNEIYSLKMNERYLKQCLYNLEEKYDCRAIDMYGWAIIKNRFKEILYGGE